jgi:hypothetical protein
MKKAYIIPEMETVELMMNCSMLAGSLPKGSESVTDESEVLSRESFFDGEY